MSARGIVNQKLYFAKVDVKACFDSLPQQALIQLAHKLLSADEYSIARHTEIKPSEMEELPNCSRASRPSKKFCARAHVGGDMGGFGNVIEQGSKPRRPNTVYVDSVVQQSMKKKVCLELLTEHVECNIVKIRKKFYRQKEGIPQGSVLSSLLCNFFYGDFEKRYLTFLSNKDCLLVRLIDDFLLISTKREHAARFLEVMHAGSPTYGISIKPEKSLVNFEVEITGKAVPKLAEQTPFPYCGMFIDSRSLDISKDSTKLKSGSMNHRSGLSMWLF